MKRQVTAVTNTKREIKLTGDATSIMLDIIALHSNLMTSNDSLESIPLTEPLGDVGAKLESDTSLTRTSSGGRFGIGPEHLHHEALLTGLTLGMSIELPDVIERDVIVREQAAVQGEILLADQCRQGKGREGFRKQLEDALVVFRLAFPFESIDLVHVVRLVISPVQEEAGRIQPFVGIQKQRDLGRPGASVDKVAVEEVGVGRRWIAIQSEDFEKVEILSCAFLCISCQWSSSVVDRSKNPP